MGKQKRQFTRSYWAENFRRTMRDWEDRQALVGFALLVLAFFGLGWIQNDPDMYKVGLAVAFGYLLLRFFVFTPSEMWRDATAVIAAFEDQLRPSLALEFRPDIRPYYQQIPTTVEINGHKTPVFERRFRVGIRNLSARTIRNVRVVLEDCEPEAVFAFIERPLHIMGQRKRRDRVDLVPGDRPTAFAEFVVQIVGLEKPHKHVSLWMSYASQQLPSMIRKQTYRVILRVEGEGAYARHDFEISHSNDDLLSVRPITLGPVLPTLASGTAAPVLSQGA